MAENVTSLFGGPTGEREVVDDCVTVLREWLAMAEAGELIGVVMAGLSSDRCARYALGGFVGGYSMIGALEVVKADLLEMNRDA